MGGKKERRQWGGEGGEEKKRGKDGEDSKKYDEVVKK